MKRGVHKETLAASLSAADSVFLYQPDSIDWCVSEVAQQCAQQSDTDDNIDRLVEKIVASAQPGDHRLVMSNGGFEGIHDKILRALSTK
jgi:UDP-N-acetylmuramate: L-alanyl-gamma-D-glutamyl-meso-diaminopimelate ligase